MIVAPSARKKLEDILTPSLNYLRIEILAGGCNGFEKKFYITEIINDDDIKIENLLIDSVSWEFVKDSILNYVDTIDLQKFELSIQNVGSNCGCGKSFSII